VRVHQFHIIWALVVSLTVVTSMLLHDMQSEEQTWRTDPTRTEHIPESPTVVIGSSLMKCAVPNIGSAEQSLLGDKRDHVRLALGGITESQTIALLERVLTFPTKRVFVEIHPLCVDFARQTRGISWTFPRQWVDRIRTFSANSRRELGTRYQRFSETRLRSPVRLLMTSEPRKLDAAFQVSISRLRETYPIHMRSPRELGRLKQLLSLAKDRHIDIALIAPPRSETALNYMGIDSARSLERHFHDLARQLELPLFQPARSWPDEYFIDQAHMNRRGRKRFCNELAKWSSERL